MLIKPIRTKKIVAVAMSGGVDSSVAAALLKKQGFRVFGLTMKTFCYERIQGGKKTCCGLEGIESAKQVCRILDIPHYTVDASKEFTKKVIEDFVSEYKAGRTPNPCVRCNQFIKFDLLLKLAKKMTTDPEAEPLARYGAGFFGTDNTNVFLATGHYAKIKKDNRGIYHLLRGKDKNKDQSYFLYNLSQKQLSQIIFPLGDLKKEEVRNLARKFKLPAAEKPESQEICFITTNLYDFLDSRIGTKSGDIVTAGGMIIGKHRGIAFYTIGQKAGIGGKGPYYVAKIDKRRNQIVVTNNSKDPLIFKGEIVVSNAHWIDSCFCSVSDLFGFGNHAGFPKPNNGNLWDSRNRTKKQKIEIQIRYKSKPVLGKIFGLGENKAKVVFDEPVFASAPGQSAVFYRGDECLGGGIIKK